MKLSLPLAVCLGAAVGFFGCCIWGRFVERTCAFQDFLRLHPYLEQESNYSPTASQLVATARAQCPSDSPKTLVVLGGNSVFNGSGQKRSELWSVALQRELGDSYHVINFSAPGAGVMDNGGVVFEVLSRLYPRMVFVTNTEPGYYSAASDSAYSYLFWDAYYKGLLRDDPARAARLAREPVSNDDQEIKLGYWLNSFMRFDDLWAVFSYRHMSTVWTSWLRERSFRARSQLPDWYDKRPTVEPSETRFAELLPGHIAALRRRKCVDPSRFRQEADGTWVQTPESLRRESDEIAAMLPDALKRRTLVVFTPINPWFIARLTPDERSRIEVSFRNGVELLEKNDLHGLSLLGQPFEPFDFGDTIHLGPAGGRRLAQLLAPAIRDLARRDAIPLRP